MSRRICLDRIISSSARRRVVVSELLLAAAQGVALGIARFRARDFVVLFPLGDLEQQESARRRVPLLLNSRFCCDVVTLVLVDFAK